MLNITPIDVRLERAGRFGQPGARSSGSPISTTSRQTKGPSSMPRHRRAATHLRTAHRRHSVPLLAAPRSGAGADEHASGRRLPSQPSPARSARGHPYSVAPISAGDRGTASVDAGASGAPLRWVASRCTHAPRRCASHSFGAVFITRGAGPEPAVHWGAGFGSRDRGEGPDHTRHSLPDELGRRRRPRNADDRDLMAEALTFYQSLGDRAGACRAHHALGWWAMLGRRSGVNLVNLEGGAFAAAASARPGSRPRSRATSGCSSSSRASRRRRARTSPPPVALVPSARSGDVEVARQRVRRTEWPCPQPPKGRARSASAVSKSCRVATRRSASPCGVPPLPPLPPRGPLVSARPPWLCALYFSLSPQASSQRRSSRPRARPRW